MKPIYKIILIILAALAFTLGPTELGELILGAETHGIDNLAAWMIGGSVLVVTACLGLFLWVYADDFKRGGKFIWDWLDTLPDKFKKN